MIGPSLEKMHVPICTLSARASYRLIGHLRFDIRITHYQPLLAPNDFEISSDAKSEIADLVAYEQIVPANPYFVERLKSGAAGRRLTRSLTSVETL